MSKAGPSAKPHAGRLVSLDVLRAVAVLLVLGRHVPRVHLEEAFSGSWLTFFQVYQRGGWIGVDLFFVLSGFLVSGLLFREYRQYGRIRPGHFLLRRGLKIYPAFYVMIAVTVLARPSVYAPALLCEILFVQNYGPSLWDHTWSLAVEEHFYLAAAFLLPLLVKRKGSGEAFRQLPRITLFYIALPALALRLANGMFFDYGHRTHLYPTLLRIDSLAFGVLLSYFFHFRHGAFMAAIGRWRVALVAGGAALLVPAFVWPLESTPFIHTVGFSLLYLGSGMILCGFLAPGRRASPVSRAVAWLGGYSYSIYLWHLPVRDAVTGLDLSARQEIALYWFGSLAVGVAAAALIEMPVLVLRDRFFPSRSKPLSIEDPSIEEDADAAA